MREEARKNTREYIFFNDNFIVVSLCKFDSIHKSYMYVLYDVCLWVKGKLYIHMYMFATDFITSFFYIAAASGLYRDDNYIHRNKLKRK